MYMHMQAYKHDELENSTRQLNTETRNIQDMPEDYDRGKQKQAWERNLQMSLPSSGCIGQCVLSKEYNVFIYFAQNLVLTFQRMLLLTGRT